MRVINYHDPEHREELDLDVEEFFSRDRASGIYLASERVPPGRYMDPVTGVLEIREFPGRFTDTNLVAVNYGTQVPNQTRGIRDGDFSWIIDLEARQLKKQKRNVLYDPDKMVDRAILENGRIQDILREFADLGYLFI